MPSTNTNRIIRLPEVKALTALSKSAIYQRIKEDKFPKPLNLGGRAVGWKYSDINQWINELQPTNGEI